VFIGTKLRSSPVLPSYSQNVFYCRECFLDKGTKHFFFLPQFYFLAQEFFPRNKKKVSSCKKKKSCGKKKKCLV